MLQPKRTKFRKTFKGRNRGLANGTDVSSVHLVLKQLAVAVLLLARSKQLVVR